MIPVVGEFTVAGFTKEEFTRQLRQKLAEYIQGDLKIAVEINSPASRITVLGTVSRQGSIPSNVEMTLLEVLSLSGGWTELSDLRYIKISRQATAIPNHATIEVDLTQYLDSGDLQGIPMVQPGDVVFVPKKQNFIREFSDLLRDALIFFGFFALFQ
jgi:polysaccharide export outer membrane protein